MAFFSKKLFGFAAGAMVFAGVASAQTAPSTCTAATPAGAALLRAEGTAEMVAEVALSCTAGPGGSAAFTYSVSPSALSITSKVLTASSNTTEAIAVVTGTGVGATTTQFQGVVAPGGNTINFSNVTVPASAFTVTFANVRVNASSISVGTGVPPSVTATVFSLGTTIQTNQNLTVGYIQRGLSNASIAGVSGATFSTTAAATNYTICNAVTAAAPAFYVRFSENFPTAFKQTGGTCTALGCEFTNNTETGVAISGNTANSGTRIAITFSNVPANATLYVPTSVVADSGAEAITLTSSASGAYSAVAAATGTGIPAVSAAALTVSGGSATAVYEVTNAVSSSASSFSVPVFFRATANSVAASSTGVSVSVSLAPTGSTNIPNFVASTQSALTGSTFNACTTSLLFPFVTNSSGFDTGIAIANTSVDPFGSRGAIAQAGTCSLNFYNGSSTAVPAVTSSNVPAGGVYTALVSGLSAGFQGYMIAQCNFQFAHGFAFITDGFGGPGRGLSQGYLALVINDTNQVVRSAGIGAPVQGYGEGLLF